MPVYVGNSISLANTGLGGTMEEEMETFKKVVEVTLDKLKDVGMPPTSLTNGVGSSWSTHPQLRIPTNMFSWRSYSRKVVLLPCTPLSTYNPKLFRHTPSPIRQSIYITVYLLRSALEDHAPLVTLWRVAHACLVTRLLFHSATCDNIVAAMPAMLGWCIVSSMLDWASKHSPWSPWPAKQDSSQVPQDN